MADFTVYNAYSKDADAIFKIFCDPAYLQAKYEALGCKNIEIKECAASGDTFRVVVKRDVPADVPGFLKSVLKTMNTVTETDEWKISTKSGTYTVKTEGVPVEIKGTMKLHNVDGGSQHDINTTVTGKVPLIGGKLADFVANDIKNTLRKDHDFTKGYAK